MQIRVGKEEDGATEQAVKETAGPKSFLSHPLWEGLP